MVSMRSIVFIVLGISFLTFTAFFGRLPGLRRTPIGWLYTIIWTTIPNALTRLDKSITGGRIAGSVSKTWNTLLYEKHPVVLIFFLTLVIGGSFLFVPAVWPLISTFQKLLMITLIITPILFTRLCNISAPNSPHIINQSNFLHQLIQYPYDYKLFHPGRICKTCQLPKPARSKHCSLCNACIARSDHHCIWINNCVGRGNYKYFVGLLLSMTVLLCYGAYTAYKTLKPEIQEHTRLYPEWHEMEYVGRQDWTGYFLHIGEEILDVLATAFLLGGVSRGGVGFLCLLTAPLPFGLLAYHIYLIWAGTTTNESGKWADWKEDMVDGLCFMTDLDTRDSFLNPNQANWGGYDPNIWKASSWPTRSNQFLVLTQDGEYPRGLPNEVTNVVGCDREWWRVWKLKDVVNIYDLGVWGNLKDMIMN